MKYEKRIKALQKWLKKKGVEALMVENPIDLFYLTGLQLSPGTLFINQKQPQLFVDGRYIEEAQMRSPVPALSSKDNAFIKALSLGVNSLICSSLAFISK